MPWHDPEDLKWFRRMTMGHHVIMGGVTYKHIAKKLDGRQCWIWGRHLDPLPMLDALKALASEEQDIWIAGGARTYEAFMPYVRRSFITHVDYDGKADIFMPPLWNAERAGHPQA